MEAYAFKSDDSLIEKRADALAEDAALKPFFMAYDVPYEAIKAGLSELMQYLADMHNCEAHSIDPEKAYQPVLGFSNGHITLSYTPCESLQKHQRSHHDSFMDASTMPKTLLQATLSDFRQDSESRQKYYLKIMQTMHALKLSEPAKGLYLYGPYMTGKTYGLAAAAKQFSLAGYHVTLMYYPDFAREIKSAIDQGTLETRIAALKKTDILMLDDLGGEGYSAWVRDEVLGPILQHRLLDQKLTYFTSNIPPKKLIDHFTGGGSENEQLKAFRIIERIQALAEPLAF